ncbi:hypothetical protein [Saccharospirillum mangrovi]|uniref:hypothetical protein n=1 Tax=Saccharospirillum mangrovi TaxID=2161747 RepID=UPI00130037CD|nr:hypothetical protein [Saccharospirillum mangrovi]
MINQSIVNRIQRIDWVNHLDFHAVITASLLELARDLQPIIERVNEIKYSDNRTEYSERGPNIDKYILYKCNDTGWSLRLHKIRQRSPNEGSESPHNHRFKIATLLLSGSYRQNIYRRINGVVDDSTIVMTHDVREGNSYTLDHDAIHQLIPYSTVYSLFFRGPAMKGKNDMFHGSEVSHWTSGKLGHKSIATLTDDDFDAVNEDLSLIR